MKRPNQMASDLWIASTLPRFDVRFAVVLLTALLCASCQHAKRAIPSAQLETLVAPAFPENHSGGVVLVTRNDKPIFRRAYGMADVELGVPMRPDHVLGTGSITKQFTAVALLQLVSQGLISLEDDVRKHLPEFETRGRAITIEQVLTHTSGLPNIVDRDDFDALARQDYDLDELLALTKDMPLHFEPGEGYRYSDTGYFLLGAIIERVSGLSYRDYLENRLFWPLGMVNTWYGDDSRIIRRRAKGYSMRDGVLVNAAYISMTVPHAAGAVFSTVDDLLQWDKALRAGAIIPQDLLKRGWTPRELPDGAHSGYGFGWKLCTLAGRPTIEHGGFVNGFLANMLRLPDDGLTIIVLVNNDSDAPDAGVVARRLARFLLTGSPDLRHQALTAEQRAALVGRYEIAPGDVREISDRNGVLHVQRNDRAARPLAALSTTELTQVDGDGAFVLSFELGTDGRAARIRSALRCEPVDAATRIDGGEQQ